MSEVVSNNVVIGSVAEDDIVSHFQNSGLNEEEKLFEVLTGNPNREQGKNILYLVRSTGIVNTGNFNKLRTTKEIGDSLKSFGYIGIAPEGCDAETCYVNDMGKSFSVIRLPKVSHQSAFYIASCRNVLDTRCERESNINLLLLDDSVEMIKIGSFEENMLKKLLCLFKQYLKQSGFKENIMNIDVNLNYEGDYDETDVSAAGDLLQCILRTEKKKWNARNPLRYVHLYCTPENGFLIGNVAEFLFEENYYLDTYTLSHYNTEYASHTGFKLPLTDEDTETLKWKDIVMGTTLTDTELLFTNMLHKNEFAFRADKHICSISFASSIEEKFYCSHEIATREDFKQCYLSGFCCILTHLKGCNNEHEQRIKAFIKNRDPLEMLHDPLNDLLQFSENGLINFFDDQKMLTNTKSCPCWPKYSNKVMHKKIHEGDEYPSIQCPSCKKAHPPEFIVKPLNLEETYKIKEVFELSYAWCTNKLPEISMSEENMKKWKELFNHTCVMYF